MKKFRMKNKEDFIERVAESWSSIDGKEEEFRQGKRDPKFEEVHGHYEGYMAEAEELLERMGLQPGDAYVTKKGIVIAVMRVEDAETQNTN